MKKRAVAYVRVSSASKAQLHSYEFQEEYWQHHFEDEPDLELVNIYADRGITASSMSKRQQFLTMMEDARQHKFDVIYTKSVSRFARNTVDLLQVVRELRDIGIEVVFENENIHTLQPTSEVFLTIAAAVAENDLKVDSERMRWSIHHRYENGYISIGNGMYGYRMTEDNTLVIIPEEAEVVRRIFEMYLNGAGGAVIAKALNAEGIPARNGGIWYRTTVLKIMENEKYMGDAMMGKSVKINYVKVNNMDGSHGKRYYIEDCHEPIVSKETWYKAQEIRKQRRNPKNVGTTAVQYPFTGIIFCGQCGTTYQHKVSASGLKWAVNIWDCKNRLKYGASTCDCTRIKDSVLREKFVEAHNQFVTERPQGETVTVLREGVKRLQQEERELAELRVQHMITESSFREEQRRIKAAIAELRAKVDERNSKTVREADFTPITEFNADKVKEFITKVIVRRGMVTFVFYNGIEITKPYSNGQSGNKPGWNKKEA